MTWHLDRTSADAYVARATDPVASASIEAHLVSCGDCQALVAATTDPSLDRLLTETWLQIDDVLDRPRLGVTGRVLRFAGCDEATVRIVTASTSARWSYLAAVVISVAMAMAAAQSGRDAVFGVFLLVAPIGPLVATAGAFGRWADPVHGLIRTLPISAWRMALVRTVASVVPAILLTLISVPLLDDRGWLAVAWLLPSLALSAAALALATWISIEPATLVMGAVWLATPTLLRPDADQLISAITGRLQFAAVVTVLVAAAVVGVRRDVFELKVLP